MFRSGVITRPTLAETDALVAACTAAPNTSRIRLWDAGMRLLKPSIFAKLDVFYLHGAHEDLASRLNWIAPGTNTLSLVSTPTRTDDRGWKGNGVDQGLDTGINAALGATKFSLDSASMFCFPISDEDSGADIGAGLNTRVIARSSGNQSARANATSGAVSSSVVTSAVGLNGFNRADSANAVLWKNGVARGTYAVASAAVSSASVRICVAGSVWTTRTQFMSGFGQSLTDDEWKTLAGIGNSIARRMGAI